MTSPQAIAVEVATEGLVEFIGTSSASIKEFVRDQLEILRPNWAGTLAEAKGLVATMEVGNFIYLRGPDLFLADLSMGSHEVALQVLGMLLLAEGEEEINDGIFSTFTAGSTEARALGERLITSGGAVFESSVPCMEGILHVGEAVKLTSFERRVFKNYVRRTYK